MASQRKVDEGFMMRSAIHGLKLWGLGHFKMQFDILLDYFNKHLVVLLLNKVYLVHFLEETILKPDMELFLTSEGVNCSFRPVHSRLFMVQKEDIQDIAKAKVLVIDHDMKVSERPGMGKLQGMDIQVGTAWSLGFWIPMELQLKVLLKG